MDTKRNIRSTGRRERINECEDLLEQGKCEKDTIYVFRKEDISEEEIMDRFKGIEYISTKTQILVVAKK